MAKNPKNETNIENPEVDTDKPEVTSKEKIAAVLSLHRAEILGLLSGRYKNASGDLVKGLLDAIELPEEFSKTLTMLQEASDYKKRIVKPKTDPTV